MSDNELRAQSVIVRTSFHFDLNTGENLGPPTVIDQVPHEQLIVQKRFQGRVDWRYWTSRPLWTVEEAFILARNYDPRRFPLVWGKRPSEEQADDLHYPFGPGEVEDIERIVADAFALEKLTPITPKSVEGLTPAQMYRQVKVQPKAFMLWYSNMKGWPYALYRELPEPLKARPEAIEAQPALSPDAQPATDIEKEKILSMIDAKLATRPRKGIANALKAVRMHLEGKHPEEIHAELSNNPGAANPRRVVNDWLRKAKKEMQIPF